MEIEEVKLQDLRPYERNPRKNEAAVPVVMESIRNFGFKVPLVIDKDNVIVCGHTRYKAAKRLGMDTVPCIRADDLTPEQIRAFRLVDNRAAEMSEWDIDLLNIELEDITDIDMGIFGFEEEPEEPEAEEDEYQVQLPVEPKTKLGEMYRLGDHLLLCGDSTDQAAVERLFTDGKSADLVITDPPYNVAYHGKAGSIQNDDMGDSEFYEFLRSAFTAMSSVMKPGGGILYLARGQRGVQLPPRGARFGDRV